MPFLLCCCSKADSVSDTVQPAADRLNPPWNNEDETFREREEQELANSIYHDARESLTASMIYAPATSFIGRMRPNLNLDDNEESQEMLTSHSIKSLAGGGAIHNNDSVVLVRQNLEHPTAFSSHGQSGYPGELTNEELEACLEFRKRIQEKREEGEPGYYEMVHIMGGVEEEAFAICRYMRARKFVVPDALEMQRGNLEKWRKGRDNDFFPNLEAPNALGCPLPMVHNQNSIFQSGIAKNGSLVFYFQGNRVSLEALDCLTDLENFEQYMWNLFVHSIREHADRAQKQNPHITILYEVTLVADLKDIPRSLFTERVMLLLKNVIAILNCFPEILSKAIVTNAPFFFSAIWLILKSFLDERTSAKIEIYSKERTGLACIQKHVDDEELISDKGGSGPSYQELLHQLRPQGSSRQIVERVFPKPNGTSDFEFSLSMDETESEAGERL